MKNFFKNSLIVITAVLTGSVACAQNFIKTDLAVSLSGSSKLVQTFDFNLNRTDEVQNKGGGVYFLYTNKLYYIVPTIDANIGESVSTSNNNIVAQAAFGHVLFNISGHHGLNTNNTRVAIEIDPTYNSDKTFTEKLYYAQIKFIWNPVINTAGGTAANPQITRVFSLGIDPLINLGVHDSKNYNINRSYSAAGINASAKLRLRKIPVTGDSYDLWTFKLSADGYYLFSEIKALYNKDYYGQLAAETDYSFVSKIAISLAYKYGNENAKYNTVNTLTLGLKYKY